MNPVSTFLPFNDVVESIIVSFVVLLIYALYRALRYRIAAWWTRRETQIVQYEPYPEVEPMAIGYLLNNRIESHLLTSGMVSLIQNGNVKMAHRARNDQFDEDFSLTLLKRETDYEIFEYVLEYFFPARIVGTEISLNEFHLKGVTDRNEWIQRQGWIGRMRQGIQSHLEQQGFIESYPRSEMMHWHIMLAIGGVLAFSAYLLDPNVGLVLTVGGLLYMLIILRILARRLTPKGYELLNHTNGFREYLSVTETNRYAFHEDPRNNPSYYMKYLPYAIALKIELEWAQLFTGEAISYATGTIHQDEDAVSFSTSLRHISNDFLGDVDKTPKK